MHMSEKIAIKAIGQIAITTSNIEASISFYRDVLGLELLFDVPPNLAFFNLSPTRLMLTTLQGDEHDHHTSVIYYTVENIEQTFSLLANHNVNIERPPQCAAVMSDHELWIGFIRDPDQHLIGIMAELPLGTTTKA